MADVAEDLPPPPNAFELPEPSKFANSDLEDQLESKSQLKSNVTKVLDVTLKSLESLDDAVTNADGAEVGERLFVCLDSIGGHFKKAADFVLSSEDNCEGLVDELLAVDQSAAPMDAEYEYVKSSLISVINSSPDLLMDLSTALRSVTIDEAVEISEVRKLLEGGEYRLRGEGFRAWQAALLCDLFKV